MLAKKLLISGCFLLCNFSLIYAQVQDTSTVLRLIEEAAFAKTLELKKEQYETAYTLSDQIDFEEGILKSLDQLIEIEYKARNHSKVLRYLLQEEDIHKNNGDLSAQAKSNESIGDLFFHLNLNREALSYYKKVESLLKSKANSKKEVLFEKLAQVYSNLEMPDSTRYYYLQAIPFNKKDRNYQLVCYRKLTEAYHKKGDYEMALVFNEKIYELLEKQADNQEALAVLYNNIGYTYNHLNKHKKAIEWFLKAENQLQKNPTQLIALYINLGVTYYNQGDSKTAIYYLMKALTLGKKEDRAQEAHINNLIAQVYFQNQDLFNAQNFNQDAINASATSRDLNLMADIYNTSADIHTALYEYEEAIDAYKKHLSFRDSLGKQFRDDRRQLNQARDDLEKAEKEITFLNINTKLQDLEIQKLTTEQKRQKLEIEKLELQKQSSDDELKILWQAEELVERELKNKALEAEQTKQNLLLTSRQLELVQKSVALKELGEKEALANAELIKKNMLLAEEEQRNKLLQQEQAMQDMELEAKQKQATAATRIGSLLFLLSLLILGAMIYTLFTNRKINRQKKLLEEEQEKSERLLLNILPASVAKELKEKGRTIPRRYENVSILFSDFVGFTSIAAQSTPEEILKELNECFMGFDAIMETEGIEKIQTVGDGYLAVGGLPIEDPAHALKCVKAAQKMHLFLAQKNKASNIQWHARIGIHSGPVTAGVIGTKKFAFSIFGDTVNTAARIETSGAKGKINISDSTYHLIKEEFQCEYRGKISAKGKGELDMYFVV